MSTINDTNAISVLESLISGLTVATETTERLVLILKTATLANVDATSIKTELLSRLAAANNSTSLDEIALLSTSLPLSTSNRSIFVTDLTDLNTLTVEPGTVVYVNNESLPYVYKSDLTWSLLFTALQSDKPAQNLQSWGVNTNGSLGDGTITNRSSPVSVAGGYTDWVQVSAGDSHSLALRANGTAWAWGTNTDGRLGDNSTTNKSSPVSVVGIIADWKDISAGGSHSIAIEASGTIWAWGANSNGELGDNTTTSRSSPVSVIGGIVDWKDISAGGSHNLALRANGTAWAWGLNTDGRLGDVSTVAKSSPVSVVGGFTDWVQVSAGSIHSLALRSNGTAWGWGGNTYGQIGDNTTNSTSSPVSVVGGFTDWVQVTGGTRHSLGIRANGTAWAWGFNGNGRLGDGTVTDNASPVSVIGGFTDWVQLSAGYSHSTGVRANGTAWGWGSNSDGKLGDNTTTDRSSPVSVTGGLSGWVQVSVKGTHTLGLRGF